MALPAGRYGVTKNQLLKIKKLPMNTIKLIEELTEKYDLLGTAAFKNSTSVVTDSTDLVESGAVKDIVGWGNKNKFDLNGDSITSNTTRTVLSDGINVKSSSASWASCIYFLKNVKNTDMGFKTSLDFVSGHTQVIVYGNSTPATAGATSIISSEVYTADGDVGLQFNSGDYEYLIIRFFVTAGTAEVGEANFNSIMLCNALDGNTYEPYHASVEESLEEKADNSVIGTVEDGVNPTKAYAVGEHMIRGGKFCTVTSPVTTSSTWVEGSNYTSGDVAGEFNPKAYISTGLSFTNCSYVAGGYAKFNNLVIINIRVSCSETVSGLNIDGFPTYTNKTISNKNIVPLKCYRMSDDSADAYYSTVGTNGRVVVYGNIIGNKEYAVSGLYLCD